MGLRDRPVLVLYSPPNIKTTRMDQQVFLLSHFNGFAHSRNMTKVIFMK
jgi:hypothetical protein